jgi:hypothetical protein
VRAAASVLRSELARSSSNSELALVAADWRDALRQAPVETGV